jgi:hypothetical protein
MILKYYQRQILPLPQPYMSVALIVTIFLSAIDGKSLDDSDHDHR